MTTLALAQWADRVPAFFRRIGHSFTDLLQGIDDARQLAHRYQVLSQLTDAELAARGIKREDIPQAVLKSQARA